MSISLKNKQAVQKMAEAGARLAQIFDELDRYITTGLTTADIDLFVESHLKDQQLESKMRGYMGYRHVSCVSVNDEVVHGVPNQHKGLSAGDLVKVDVCASWRGYAADMARCFFVDGVIDPEGQKLVENAQMALDKGIEAAVADNTIGDISAAIQEVVQTGGFGVVRDFAGHGIGKRMHEDPEVLNYGVAGSGPRIRVGMAFALEPMTTYGGHQVYVTSDGWTVKTRDKSLAAHVEDTVIVTNDGPRVITRLTA